MMLDKNVSAVRFSRCRELLLAANDPLLMGAPLSSFLDRDESHLPQHLTHQSIRDVLETDFCQLCRTPYFGNRKLERLLVVLERVAERATKGQLAAAETELNPTADAAVALQPPDVGPITADGWQQCCDAIHTAGLDYQPLGRFAPSLADLPRSLWQVPLSEFTSRSFDQVAEMPGYGPARLSLVFSIVRNLAEAVAGFASLPHLCPRVYPRNIHDAASWIEHGLQHKTPPSVDELRGSFLLPLFKQLDADLGAELTQLIRRRVGLDGTPETLDAIAKDRGLTRERVRQLTGRASGVIAVRWPEGKHFLDDFYEMLLSDSSATEQVTMISLALDELFDVKGNRGISRTDVLPLWERAGRSHKTPMFRENLLVWAGETIPNLSPEVAVQWITQDAPSCVTEDGRTLYFSHDPDDLLLRRVFVTREPVSLSDLPEFIDSDERSIRGRLNRDPRFIEDEYKRVHASELLSVRRRDGRWSVGLISAPGHDQPRRTEIPLDCLILMIVAGLTQRGVADATVWGTYRFANEVLARLYGAHLPRHITPFILSEILVLHSDGAVRHMRRRRLRWDCADAALPVRGKHGWIDYVVTEARCPITVDELDAALRRHYQDYERYVFTQLTTDGDEDGRGLSDTSIIPGVGTRIPLVFVSRSWALNDTADNVSEGIRLFGTRIISATGKQRFTRQQLQRLPWMVRWCERHSYGLMNWADDGLSEVLDETDPNTIAPERRGDLQPSPVEPFSTESISKNGGTTSSDDEIPDILSRFL